MGLLAAHCVLALALLCHPVQHKSELILTGVQAGFMFADGVQAAGQREFDPLARPFVGSPARWNRMLPAGALIIFGTASIGRALKDCNCRARKLWWLPAAVSIAGTQVGLTWSFSHP